MIDCAEYYTAYKDRTPVYLIQWPFDEPWRIISIAETSEGFLYEIENIVTGTTTNVKGKDISLDSKYGKVEEEKSVKVDIKAAKFYQEFINNKPVYQIGSDTPLFIKEIKAERYGDYDYLLYSCSNADTVYLNERYIKNTPKTDNTDSIRYAKRYHREYIDREQVYSRNSRAGKLNIALRCFLAYRKIIFSGPCTIVLWADGTKTMARVTEGETFDPEKGVAICFMKRMLDHTVTNKILREAHSQYKGNEKVVDQMVKEYIEAKDQQITEYIEEDNNGVHET